MTVREGGKVLLLGFYGCRAAGSVVAVRTKAKSRPTAPRRRKLKCPACGETHHADFMWRHPRDRAELDKASVRVR